MELTKQRLAIPISDDRRAEIERLNAEIDIALLASAEELSRAQAAHKEATDLPKKHKKEYVGILRTGYEYKDVEVMEFINEDDGTCEYVDGEGNIVSKRALSMAERQQYRIKFGRK